MHNQLSASTSANHPDDFHESSTVKLVNCISQVLIIASKESTEQLEKVLQDEGLKCEVLRQEAQPQLENFSRSYLCLLNHCRAWEKASQESQPTLIIEADFVPILGFGNLPLPFNIHQSDVGVSWLYNCASQVYYVSPEGYAEGFSVSTVAYIVTPQSSRYLMQLAAEITEQFGPHKYSSWDSNIDNFLRERKLKNYIPWQNYGEHGGLANPEHYQNNLSKTHRADVLYGKLAFMPLYAVGEKGEKLQFLRVRLQARLKGIGRLLTGRFLRIKTIKNSSMPVRLISFALVRHLTFRL